MLKTQFLFLTRWLLLLGISGYLTACGDALPYNSRGEVVTLPSDDNVVSNPNGPGQEPNDPQLPEEPEEPEAPTFYWKGAVFTGDNSITAFDNARRDIKSTFLAMDPLMMDEDIKELSMSNNEVNAGAEKMSKSNFEQSLLDLNLGANDRCLIHMTSHGSRSAFYLVNQGGMTPNELDQILDNTCGKRPTVLLISACYSGIFTDSSAMQQDNRIILSAARKDRTSFGCSPEAEYTYWDGCLLDHLESSNSWENLYENVAQCISQKESRGSFTPSLPQFFMGSAMKDLPYLGQE